MYICDCSCFNIFICFCFRQMYRNDTCRQCHLNDKICKNIVFCILVIILVVRPIFLSDLKSSHRDVIPLITVFCVFVYVLVHYVHSTVNVQCLGVKVVHIVKQTINKTIRCLVKNKIKHRKKYKIRKSPTPWVRFHMSY
jgi:hypothetical protein